jgi:hypothetical protein
MKIEIHANVYLCSSDGELLRRFDSLAANVQSQGASIMATVQELSQAVSDLNGAFAPLPQAINDLEAKVTAAVASAGISAADQAALDQAIADIKNLTAGVSSAVTDATDGVDEAAAPPAPADGTAPPADGTQPAAPTDAAAGPT